jgi:cytochrome c-type biogenesis protein CcmF
MAPGDQAELAGYRFQFQGARSVKGANFSAEEGLMIITEQGKLIATLHPQKRSYAAQRGQMMTEAAIDNGLFRDLYVALGEPLAEGAWAVRLHYKPFVRWIWLGAILMSLGGALAATDKRYRLRLRATSKVVQANLAEPALNQ